METYRLKIRPYQMTDLEAAVTIFSDTEMMTYYPAPFSKQKTMEWLEWSIEHYQRNGMGALGGLFKRNRSIGLAIVE